MADDETTAVWAVKRKLANARREVMRAVERFDKISDPLPGHRAEALRRARDVKQSADAAVAYFDEPT